MGNVTISATTANACGCCGAAVDCSDFQSKTNTLGVSGGTCANTTSAVFSANYKTTDAPGSNYYGYGTLTVEWTAIGSTVFGFTDYTVNGSWSLAGGEITAVSNVTFANVAVGASTAVYNLPNAAARGWCAGNFTAQPFEGTGPISGPYAFRANVTVSNGNTYPHAFSLTIANAEIVIENTLGNPGGYAGTVTETVQSNYEDTGTPWDNPTNCEIGYVEYLGDGSISYSYFERLFNLSGLTSGNCYELVVSFETRALGETSWTGTVDQVLTFEATGTTENAGWVGIGFDQLSSNTEWRYSGYVLNDNGAGPCGGPGP